MAEKKSERIGKKEWLDKIYYFYGKQQCNFFVAGCKEGRWTKWKTYLETVGSINPDEDWKIGWINQRQILPNEVVLDLEDRKQLPKTIEKLKEWNIKFNVFSTGSRGYHVHLWFKDDASEVKEGIIKFFDADKQKCHKKSMIALEYCPHYKSGKIKKEVNVDG